MSNLSLRDSFFNELYKLAEKDKDIMLVVGDMGAPALDKFRRDFPDQYFNVGIAEHNMLSVGAGLAKEGKKVYNYAIAPFATSRCYEFIKLNLGLMKLPMSVIGIGPGFGYEDSGPTHHTTEDISIIRAIPNIEIFSPSDVNSAAAVASLTYKSGKPSYIRLDRQILPDLYSQEENFEKGFKEFYSPENPEVGIITTGNMVHQALKVREDLHKQGESIGVIDVCRIKPLNPEIKEVLSKYKKIVSLEEHLLDGGFGSMIGEVILDNDLPVKLKRIGLTNYIYAYGGRENVRKEGGIGYENILEAVKKLI